ncbi:MAG: class I SAM-dependent methyltransferase [Anaerolineae bacterium]|nr:class I SAM-dependent methyltransferase [Anaerolineae bacterium]
MWNASFRSNLMHYEGFYENSLHFSPTFQKYADSLIMHLIEQFDLYNKEIVEIGSGSGDFLRLLCERGGNRGVGFEPSAAAETAPAHPGLRFIRRTLTPADAGLPLDFVCCRHTLEHVADPRAFVRTVRQVIGARAHVGLYFEVPDGGYMLHHPALWDVIYEHVSYFTAPSLTRLFADAGFAVTAVYSGFGGQFLCLEGTSGPGPGLLPETEALPALAEQAARFAERYAATARFWWEQTAAWAREGRRVVVWGAGSKAISFLNQMTATDAVACVVDINPRKQGMFISGVGKLIVSPAFLRSYPPDIVLVMNPNYRDEIAAMLAEVGVVTAAGGRPELIVVGEAGAEGP